jgi:hypothetical protein
VTIETAPDDHGRPADAPAGAAPLHDGIVHEPGGADPWGPDREHYSPLGDAEEQAVAAIGAWWARTWKDFAIGWRRFWGPRLLRLGAQWRHFRKWLALAVAPKTDGVIAEMTSVQGFLAATPLSPFRAIAWVTMAISALFALMWGWVAFVRLPAVKAERDVALSDAQTALEANGKWKGAYDAMKARVDAGDAAMRTQAMVQARELVAAGQRAATNQGIRSRAAKRQKEILDAGRAGGGDGAFDGGEWVRRRLEAEGDRGAGDAAGAPGGAAGVAPGVLPEGG